jgi:hypothetical protein
MMPCVTSARNNRAAWENLSTLQAGQKIQVVEMNSKKDKGTFLNVSETAISLQLADGVRTIQRQDVRNVKLMKHAHRLRNTLIGAGVGFGAGFGIGVATENRDVISHLENRLLGGGIGLLGGAVVGALLPSHKTVYRAKAQ